MISSFLTFTDPLFQVPLVTVDNNSWGMIYQQQNNLWNLVHVCFFDNSNMFCSSVLFQPTCQSCETYWLTLSVFIRISLSTITNWNRFTTKVSLVEFVPPALWRLSYNSHINALTIRRTNFVSLKTNYFF